MFSSYTYYLLFLLFCIYISISFFLTKQLFKAFFLFFFCYQFHFSTPIAFYYCSTVLLFPFYFLSFFYIFLSLSFRKYFLSSVHFLLFFPIFLLYVLLSFFLFHTINICFCFSSSQSLFYLFSCCHLNLFLFCILI